MSTRKITFPFFQIVRNLIFLYVYIVRVYLGISFFWVFYFHFLSIFICSVYDVCKLVSQIHSQPRSPEPFTTFPCLCQYPRNCPTFSFFIENRKGVYILISFNVYTILFENWEEKKLKLGSNREK